MGKHPVSVPISHKLRIASSYRSQFTEPSSRKLGVFPTRANSDLSLSPIAPQSIRLSFESLFVGNREGNREHRVTVSAFTRTSFFGSG